MELGKFNINNSLSYTDNYSSNVMLSQKHAHLILKKYSLPYPEIYIIDNKNEIKHLKLNFPIILKIDSPEIIHKTDFGLIFPNIISYVELHKKIEIAEHILNQKSIKNYSFVIQQMIKGKELILGMKKDPIFGKIIILGIGGIFVEIIKDFSIRILPIRKKDCYSMIDELKSKKYLENFRNTKPINKEALINLMLKFSNLCLNEKFHEIDFNPIIANENNCYVVDARFISK